MKRTRELMKEESPLSLSLSLKGREDRYWRIEKMLLAPSLSHQGREDPKAEGKCNASNPLSLTLSRRGRENRTAR